MANSIEAELRHFLAQSCSILYRLGLTDYMGHPSARVPGTDRVIIKPRHSLQVRAMDRVSGDDMVVIDLEGNLIEGQAGPPSERFIHTCIYKARPEVQAIVHTHQPLATMMGVAGAPILPILHVEAPLVEHGLAVWPCAKLVTDNGLGEELAAALGNHAVGILQGHGIVSVAGSVQDATIGAIHLERLAEANYRVLSINRQPRVIPPDEIAHLKERQVGNEVRWAYYAELAGVLDA